jgi:hypothetical protein
MPMPSLAQELFDTFRQLGNDDRVAFIHELVAKETAETDWIDFKRPPIPDLTDPKWKSMWSEALAGFANNQGGVLIWGVKAVPDPVTKQDFASAVQPVIDPVGVKTRLGVLQRDATDPPIGNVKIETCEITGDPVTGFVVCFVPDGPYKPYRTTAPDWQFIIRMGDSFRIMPKSILQLLFYPRFVAIFRARAELGCTRTSVSGRPAESLTLLTCTVDLVNSGTATAKNMVVRSNSYLGGHASTIQYDSPEWSKYCDRVGHRFEAVRPLHPDEMTRVFNASWHVAADTNCEMSINVLCSGEDPVFDLYIYCENQQHQHIKLEFDLAELCRNGRCTREATAAE